MTTAYERYRDVVYSVSDGYAHHRVVLNDRGEPIDYVFLDVNPAFEKQTGLDRECIIGRRVTEVLPDIVHSEFDWIGTYGRVAATGRTESFEAYSEPLACWYEVTVYGDEPGHFITVFHDVTARRLVEQPLREREREFQALVEHSLDAVALVSPDGTIRMVNDAWLTLFGYTLEEATMINAKDLYVDPLDRNEFVRKISELGCIRDEVWHKRKDGSQFYAQRSAVAQKDSSGAVIGFQTILSDITERRAAEEALRLSEEKYRILFEQSMDPISLVSPDDMFLAVNQAWLDLFGYTRADLQHINVYAIYADPSERADFIRRVSEAGSVRTEVRFKRKDGTIFDCQRSTVQLIDAQGRLIGYQGIYRDVTEQRAAGEVLRVSEEKYRSLFEQSMDAIALVSPDGCILEANPAFCRLFGYADDELVGFDSSQMYVAPNGRQRFLEAIHERGALVDDEVQLQRKDGLVMDCLRTVTVRRDREGNVVGYQPVIRDVTAAKRAEGALRESEERFSALFRDSPVSILIHDADTGRIIDANHAACSMYGACSVEEFLDVDLWLEPPYSFDDALSWIRKADSGDPQQFEWLTHTVNGQRFWVQVALRRVVINCVRRIMAVAIDITDRKAAEQALRESEEKFRALFEQSIDAISISRPDGTGIEANSAWLRLFGYETEDLPHLNFRDLYVDLADREEFLCRMNAQYSVEDEVRLKKKDGTKFICQRSAVARRNERGEITLYQGVFHDVTEERCAQERIRESEDKYRTLFEQSRDAIYIATPDGISLDCNQAWLDLLGYTREESSRLSAYDVYADPGSRDDYVKRLERQGYVQDDECQLRRKDGTVLDCIRTVTIRRDAQGRSIAYQAVVRDVTAQKHAREELESSRMELQSLAARLEEIREEERTGIARELHDQVGQCLTALKLDLVSWQRSLGRGEEISSTDLREMARVIEDITNDVRRISSELRPGLLDDMGLIAAMQWQLVQLEERAELHCELRAEVDDSMLSRAQTTALFRVFQELLTNVVRHAAASSVMVALLPDGSAVTLTIADNGRGITEQQAHDSGSLGLIGIRERLRPFGGSIRLSGVPGEGTTARVTLPLY